MACPYIGILVTAQAGLDGSGALSRWVAWLGPIWAWLGSQTSLEPDHGSTTWGCHAVGDVTAVMAIEGVVDVELERIRTLMLQLST